MRALAHAVWGDEKLPDCTRCVRDATLRAELGCDAPAPRAVLRLLCGACYGRDPACSVCKGAGETEFMRCPRRQAEVEMPRVGLVFRLFQQYETHGVLPGPGGFADQPSELVHAFEVIGGEKNRIEVKRQENEERKRAAEKARAAKAPRGSIR